MNHDYDNDNEGRIFLTTINDLQGASIEADRDHRANDGTLIPRGTPGLVDGELYDHGADMYGFRADWFSENFPSGLCQRDYWIDQQLELIREVPDNTPQREAALAATQKGLTQLEACTQTYERYQQMEGPRPSEAEAAARALWDTPAQQPEVFSRANAGEKLNILDTGLEAGRAEQREVDLFQDTLLSWGGPIQEENPARALWENTPVEPAPQIERTPERSNER